MKKKIKDKSKKDEIADIISKLKDKKIKKAETHSAVAKSTDANDGTNNTNEKKKKKVIVVEKSIGGENSTKEKASKKQRREEEQPDKNEVDTKVDVNKKDDISNIFSRVSVIKKEKEMMEAQMKKDEEMRRNELEEIRKEIKKRKRAEMDAKPSRVDPETGLKIYTAESLRIGKGNGDTPQCPFDCDCCF